MSTNIITTLKQPQYLPLKLALVSIGFTTALALLSKMTEVDQRRYSHDTIRKVKELINSSTQQMAIAKQSTNPVIALMSITTALAYAKAARNQISNKTDLAKITGVHIDELLHILRQEQMEQQKKINGTCPQLQPEGAYAVATGWVG